MRRYIDIKTKKITVLALLIAAVTVGRLLFQFIPNIQPMTAILLFITWYIGLKEAVLVAVMSLVLTNLYLGMGPWLIGQILGFIIIIFLCDLLNKRSFFSQSIILQVVFFFSSGLIYGGVLAVFDVFFYRMPNFWAYYLQGISFDLLHAFGNLVFYFLLKPFARRLFISVKNSLK